MVGELAEPMGFWGMWWYDAAPIILLMSLACVVVCVVAAIVFAFRERKGTRGVDR